MISRFVMLAAFAVLSACVRGGEESEPRQAGYGQTREAVMTLIGKNASEGRSLSGVQVNEYEAFIRCSSIERIYELTGKWPAILGLEMMFLIEYPPYREYFMRRAREHASRGGLIALTWHERNPIEVCPRGEFYMCSQHPMTDESLARLLDPSTPEHALWAGDVDAVADVLKELDAAGISPIFRPYHEMNGGWFWWGRKTAYADLWRALHDRLTEKHGLKNLVWTWSPDKESAGAAVYYPGDGFVDFVGADLYSKDRTGPMYETAKENVASLHHSGSFAFTEIGLLPAPDLFLSLKPWWFLLWGGEFIDRRWASEGCALCNEAEDVAAIFALPTVVTVDELEWPESIASRIRAAARTAAPQAQCPATLIEQP
ncbi:MAG: glycosyl hydrolase [Pseudomonadota bacterium]|nr:glycosyl hydrolase [Pseudomonadota bacterium]